MTLKLFLSLVAVVLIAIGVYCLVVPAVVFGAGWKIWLLTGLGTKFLEWFIDQLRAEYPNLGKRRAA